MVGLVVEYLGLNRTRGSFCGQENFPAWLGCPEDAGRHFKYFRLSVTDVDGGRFRAQKDQPPNKQRLQQVRARGLTSTSVMQGDT